MYPERIRPPVKKVYFRGRPLSIINWFFLIIFSPFLLIIDAFKPKNSRKIVLAYLWFMLIVTLMTGSAYLLSEVSANRLEGMLAEFFYPGEASHMVKKEIQEIINRCSVMFNVNPQLVMAVMKVESGFNPKARSPKGACGLMQLMPLVWRHYNPSSICRGGHPPGNPDHGADCIYDIEANIRTGVRYLRDLISYYDGEIGLALEAYNAGLTNVDMERKAPKFRETRNYLNKIAVVLAPLTGQRIEGQHSFIVRYRAFFRVMLVVSQLGWFLFVFWIIKRLL